MTSSDGVIRSCTHPRARHEHGTLNAYLNDRCRCTCCRAAHSAHARARRRLHAYGRSQPRSISALGSRRRVEALACLGWSMQVLSIRLGWVPERLCKIFTDGGGISPANAAKIAALYEQLWDQPAPASCRETRKSSTRIRNMATARGYLPPLTWDDIDNDLDPPLPHLDPVIDEVAIELVCTGTRVPITKAERFEVVRLLTDKQQSDREIAARIGVTPAAVFKIRHRKLVGVA